MIRYRVLGSLRVERDGAVVPVTARRERELLATLLLQPGEPISVGQLVDVLWGDDPPATVETALQVYVSALRKKLGPDSIVTGSGGYSLVTTDAVIDWLEFERLVKEGRQAAATDVPRLAYRSLTHALALFRGPRAFDDIADRPSALPLLGRLEEHYWGTIEARFEVGLSLGKHGELIPEIRERLNEQPHRERLVAALMLALYRAGRAVEALEAFAAFREVLLEDLGLDPGPALVKLERAILEQSPALALDFPAPPPRHLPTAPAVMIGREAETALLTRLIVGDRARVVTLTGAGGIGKTRLALAVASVLRADFEDGSGWIDLGEVQPGNDVLRAIAESLGTPIPQGGSAETALIRAFQPFEYLLVLDNFEHLVEQAGALGPLLRECPALQLIVTSREPLRLRAETVVMVEPLRLPATDDLRDVATAPGTRLFVERANAAAGGFSLDDSNRSSVASVCRRLDGLPLALELAAAQLHRARLTDVESLADRINEPGPRDLPARQRTMGTAIQWSVDLLPPNSRERLLALVPFVAGFPSEAAAWVWDCTERESRTVLEELAQASLLQTSGDKGRFRMLEPIRDWCATTLGLAYTGVRRAHLEWAIEETMKSRPEPGLRGAQADTWAAMIGREMPNIRAATASAAELGAWHELARLIHAVWLYWYTHGMNDELSGWVSAVLPHVAELEDLDGARVLSIAGEVARLRSDLEAAENFKLPALAAAERANDIYLQAQLLADLSGVSSHRDNFSLALEQAERALALREQLGDIDGVVHALVAVGDVARLAGSLDRANETFERAVAISRERNLLEGEMIATFFLADTARRGRDWQSALRHLASAVQLAQRLEDAVVVADSHLILALIATGLESHEVARQNFEIGFQLSLEVGYEPDLPDDYARATILLAARGLNVAAPSPQSTRMDATALAPRLLSCIRGLAEPKSPSP